MTTPARSRCCPSFTGRSTWRGEVGEAEVWDGYTVVQAKFLQTPSETKLEQAWFRAEVAAELNHWADEDSRRRSYADWRLTDLSAPTSTPKYEWDTDIFSGPYM